MPASRLFRAIGVLGIAAALGGFVTAAPAAASTTPPGSGGPPVSHNNEGPAGPPALLPNGRPAAAPSLPPALSPSVTTPGPAAGCVAAPYGANFYAPPFGSAKTVALTFDDGPGPSTQGIISVLRRYGVTATFFNIGQNAAAYPALVRTEAADGYLVREPHLEPPQHDHLVLVRAGRADERGDRGAGEPDRMGAVRVPATLAETTTRRH